MWHFCGGDGQRWSESGYNLKNEQRRFAERLDKKCEKKEILKTNSKFLA